MKFPAVFLLSLIAVTNFQDGQTAAAPPKNIGRPYEKELDKNQTMDGLITQMLGGVDIASNMILADDGNILAELDMYLTQDQFLSMYQPPEPEEMKKMGMMRAPLGAPQKSNDNLFDHREDYKGSGIRTKRKAVRDTRLRWTKGEMPYLFAKGHFDPKEEYMMRRAMTEWERYTCLSFKPATSDDKNSVQFQNGVGCNSQLGMVGGIQALNLQAPGCRYKGLYLHEIGHAVGLVHEHQLPDRDNYISILYHNVSPHMRIWFNKYTSKEVNQMQVPYELSSVMHYGITAFSYNAEAQTIKALDRSKEDTIGKVYLKELAYTDVHIVNKMYNCSSHCPNQNQCGSDGHLDQNCNCICRDGSSDCDKTKQRTDTSYCRNNYNSWACYIWANQGECERNPLYMKRECSKACGFCGKEPSDQGECKDVFANKCPIWKERGDCITNHGWMKKHCKATCNLCGDTRPEVNCVNAYEDETKCEDWAKDGECSVNAQWMFDNCKKSCAFCDKDEVTTGGTDGGDGDTDNMKCHNTNENCDHWARTGECENNPSWMINNCRKACKKCDDNTCKNLYDDTECTIWAQKLECLTNPEWMAKQCAKSCGRGVCKGVDPGDNKTTPQITPRTTQRTTPRTDGGRTTATPRPTPTTGGVCENLHNSDTQCSIWAQNDHCTINPGWMLKYCAKACQVCKTGGDRSTTKGSTTTDNNSDGGTTNGCEDRDSGCAGWAKHGFCESNPRYNLIYCKKSCNNCNGCRDAEFLCGVWAKDGHCERNPGYMLRQCQKSCKACYMSQKLLDLRPEENKSTQHLMTSLQLFIMSIAVALVKIYF